MRWGWTGDKIELSNEEYYKYSSCHLLTYFATFVTEFKMEESHTLIFWKQQQCYF